MDARLTITVDDINNVLTIFNVVELLKYTGSGTPSTPVDLVDYTTMSGIDQVNHRTGVSDIYLNTSNSQYYFTDPDGTANNWYISRYTTTATGTYSGWSDPIQGDDGDLYFNTSAYQDSITNLHVHLEVSTSSLGGSDYLDIQLQKESSGYDLIQKITSNGNFIIDKDFSSNPADYVNPDGRMCINFYAPSGSLIRIRHVSIDYAYINVTTSRIMVSPFQVNLNVNGTSFIGTWNDSFAILHGPWNSGQISFFFDCNNLYSVSFNVRTNLWINKTNYANSTYIRGSGNVPLNHYWRINFK